MKKLSELNGTLDSQGATQSNNDRNRHPATRQIEVPKTTEMGMKTVVKTQVHDTAVSDCTLS